MSYILILEVSNNIELLIPLGYYMLIGFFIETFYFMLEYMYHTK